TGTGEKKIAQPRTSRPPNLISTGSATPPPTLPSPRAAGHTPPSSVTTAYPPPIGIPPIQKSIHPVLSLISKSSLPAASLRSCAPAPLPHRAPDQAVVCRQHPRIWPPLTFPMGCTSQRRRPCQAPPLEDEILSMPTVFK
uniref:Uncharacterized protein n=1 Tax=Triticum urartu TaxID=4572 RepID=A0A8R7U683_TRIUA